MVTLRRLIFFGSFALAAVASALTLIDTIDVPSAITHFVAVDDSRNRAYVTTSNNEKSVAVIDGANVDDGMMGNEVVVATVNLTMDDVSLFDLVVDRPRNRIYVVQPAQAPVIDEVMVLDGDTNMEIDRVEVGNSPQVIAVDESRNLIYVANNASANVTVIDGSLVDDGMDGNEVVDTIPSPTDCSTST